MSAVTIGIIGGTGGMGRWFNRFFTDAGHRVLVSGRKTELTYRDLCRESQIVMLSVPMDAATKISADIGPALSEDQIVMEI